MANGMGVIANDPTQQGNSSVMQYNLVQQGVFSRGIWLSGVTNIAVTPRSPPHNGVHRVTVLPD
jgi:hypothetical protein